MCVWGGRYFFFPSPSCSVTGARHAVISQALWEQGDGTILTPGPTSPSPDKGFSPTRKSFKPVKDQRARSVKTSPEAALLPLLLLSVWSYCVLAVMPSLAWYSLQGQTLLLELTHYSYHKFPWNLFLGFFLHLGLNRWNTNLPGAVVVLNIILSGLQNGTAMSFYFPVHAYILLNVRVCVCECAVNHFVTPVCRFRATLAHSPVAWLVLGWVSGCCIRKKRQ